jgi:membrane protein DedA with SNARE-associated domain
MTVLSDFIRWFIDNVILAGMAYLGYGGIIFLMALESACIPIPSEVIMPAAGYLSWKGEGLNIVGVILAGSLGSMLGSLAAYYAGLKLGRPLIVRYGKYIFMSEGDIERAEKWFAKYGGKATFISRMVPVVRTFISLPAGIGKMEIKRFTAYSFIGSIPWCAFLAILGYYLKDSWRIIFEQYGHYVDYAVIIGIIAAAAYFFYLRRKKGTGAERRPAPK